jgi:amino-acid N-acetyltransferase
VIVNSDSVSDRGIIKPSPTPDTITSNYYQHEDDMIRKAKLNDIKEIQRLIKLYAPRGGILPRSLSELYDTLRDFFVFVRHRKVIGICALHICWDDLAEIRSLAVEEEDQSKGIGAKLVKACLEESRLLGVKRVFALTYQPNFFEQLGFKKVDKTVLPHKIWTDCLKCVKFPDCDEMAVLKEVDPLTRSAAPRSALKGGV